MKKLILFYLAFQASIAIGFPDMVRHGYASCNACHVSPSGGGVLNAYGRAVSSEVLSTIRSEGSTRYFIPHIPSWLNFGGDIRYLNITSEAYNFKYHRHFLMQSDFELAISPVPGLTVVGAVGFYNVNFPEKNYRKIEAEQRRNFVLLSLGKYAAIMAGRYQIPYGIKFPDHTLATRGFLGFGEGQETLNVTGLLQSRFGEILFSGVNGTSGSVNVSRTDGYQWQRTSGESGFVFNSNVLLGRSSSIGFSGLRLVEREAKKIRTAYGLHGTLAPIIPQIYTQFEIDQQIITGQNRDTIWVARQGLEPYRGIHFLATYEGVRSLYSDWRWTLQLFPISHIELLAEYQRRVSEHGLKTEQWNFLAHWYF